MLRKGGDNEENKLESEQTNGDSNKAPSFWTIKKSVHFIGNYFWILFVFSFNFFSTNQLRK